MALLLLYASSTGHNDIGNSLGQYTMPAGRAMNGWIVSFTEELAVSIHLPCPQHRGEATQG